MAPVLLRVILLAVGFGVVENGLSSGLVEGSLAGWALLSLVGLPLIVAGSASFMVPLLGGAKQNATSTDA